MKREKAKKVFTIYGTYSNVVTYEYRGKYYDVEYPTCNSYCCTSPKVQHDDAQKSIDAELDNPSISSEDIASGDVDDAIKSFLNYCER